MEYSTLYEKPLTSESIIRLMENMREYFCESETRPNKFIDTANRSLDIPLFGFREDSGNIYLDMDLTMLVLTRERESKIHTVTQKALGFLGLNDSNNLNERYARLLRRSPELVPSLESMAKERDDFDFVKELCDDEDYCGPGCCKTVGYRPDIVSIRIRTKPHASNSVRERPSS